MNKEQPTTRKRKLQAEHQPRSYASKIVPSLHLAGLWLAENGFKAGDTVTITIEQNQLTIKK